MPPAHLFCSYGCGAVEWDGELVPYEVGCGGVDTVGADAYICPVIPREYHAARHNDGAVEEMDVTPLRHLR